MVTNVVPPPRSTPWIRMPRLSGNDDGLDEAMDLFAANVLPLLRVCRHPEDEPETLLADLRQPTPEPEGPPLDARYYGDRPVPLVPPVEPRSALEPPPVPHSPVRRRSVAVASPTPGEPLTADQKRAKRNATDRARRLHERRRRYSAGEVMPGPWGKL